MVDPVDMPRPKENSSLRLPINPSRTRILSLAVLEVGSSTSLVGTFIFSVAGEKSAPRVTALEVLLPFNPNPLVEVLLLPSRLSSLRILISPTNLNFLPDSPSRRLPAFLDFVPPRPQT